MSKGKIKVAPDGNSAKLTGKGIGQGTNVKMPAKAQTNIDSVKIDKTDTKLIDKPMYSLDEARAAWKMAWDEQDLATAELESVGKKNPEYVAILAKINELLDYSDLTVVVWDEALAEEERIIKADPNLARAKQKEYEAMLTTRHFAKIAAIPEEKYARDEMDKAEAEARDAEDKNPEYLAVQAKISKMEDSKSIDTQAYSEAVNKLESIISEDLAIAKAHQKLSKAIDNSIQARKYCRNLGITDDQLLK